MLILNGDIWCTISRWPKIAKRCTKNALDRTRREQCRASATFKNIHRNGSLNPGLETKYFKTTHRAFRPAEGCTAYIFPSRPPHYHKQKHKARSNLPFWPVKPSRHCLTSNPVLFNLNPTNTNNQGNSQ